jgi:hypothetical protein
VGIRRHTRRTDFVCDLCGSSRGEVHGSSWDEARAATAMAKQEGWRLSKEGGQWKAFCPNCSVDTGYSIEDVLR